MMKKTKRVNKSDENQPPLSGDSAHLRSPPMQTGPLFGTQFLSRHRGRNRRPRRWRLPRPLRWLSDQGGAGSDKTEIKRGGACDPGVVLRDVPGGRRVQCDEDKYHCAASTAEIAARIRRLAPSAALGPVSHDRGQILEHRRKPKRRRGRGGCTADGEAGDGARRHARRATVAAVAGRQPFVVDMAGTADGGGTQTGHCRLLRRRRRRR